MSESVSTTPIWLLVAMGSLLTVGALLAFLYALHLGLRRRLWWPLLVIASVWLLAMALYSAWEFDVRHDKSQPRVESPP